MKKIFSHIWDQSSIKYSHTPLILDAEIVTPLILDGELVIQHKYIALLNDVIITDNLFMKNGMKKQYKEYFSDQDEPSSAIQRSNIYVLKTNSA